MEAYSWGDTGEWWAGVGSTPSLLKFPYLPRVWEASRLTVNLHWIRGEMMARSMLFTLALDSFS
jgi:hypothetical protein